MALRKPTGPNFEYLQRGTVLPANKYNGQRFYDTDLNEWFYRDQSRLKWLSFSIITIGVFAEPNSAGVTNTNLFYGAGTGSDARSGIDHGFLVPYECTVIGMVSTWVSAHSATIRLQHRDQSVPSTKVAQDLVHSSTQRESNMLRNYNVDATDRLYVRVIGTVTSAGNATAFLRRRHP